MCMNCPPAIDLDAKNAFGERVLGIVNHATLALMISIGHRTGLYDTLAGLDLATSEEIAAAAGLNERYVREWLGAMVTGEIITYNPADKTYRLPPAHAAMLTRQASPENAASMMQWISVLGGVEDQIVDCFHNGGGVHYSAYARFHDVMAEESDQTVVSALADHILPIAPAVAERLRSGIDVLDVGCGAGGALIRLAELFPNSRFTGFDFSAEAIGKAQTKAAERGLTNIDFEVRDVAELGQTDAFDLITAFDAIHDQRDPARVLEQIEAALRPGGTFFMQDIDTSSHLEKNLEHPIGPMLYSISTMHCMTVSLAQDGAGLGTCWGEELARSMLAEAGFGPVEVHRLPHDVFNCYYIIEKA